MIIKWYPEAIDDLQQIARYIDDQFGEKCCNTFLKEVMNVEKSICANPQLGKEEPLLKNQPITYRSFVVARKDKSQIIRPTKSTPSNTTIPYRQFPKFGGNFFYNHPIAAARQ
ncbi:MAG: type II toxin-antitoxin system RelE/ParE family toxin [Bacteroidales bacterium]|nr:type II toxin-antitoxin system RelE/ParE family toxin [Bacteroidales bacterium]